MKQATLEELLEAGAHFGHQVTRSNPKARDFVFEARDNIQIIDLIKTKEGLDEATEFVRNLGKSGGSLLVVGTKRQAREILEQEIKRVKELLVNDGKGQEKKLFSITQRWIGGVLTNFNEVSKNFKKLADLIELQTNPEERAKYTKKELGLFDKERVRLESFYKGVLDMTGKPDCVFIIDSHLENLAVRECLAMGVETVAMVDTNADPYVIDHPIPANDDAAGSIKLIVSHVLDAWAEGIQAQKPPAEEKKEAPTTVKAAEKKEAPKKEAKENPKAKKLNKVKSVPSKKTKAVKKGK